MVYATLTALKDLLVSTDHDAGLASIHVLDAVLRHVPETQRVFAECRGVDALNEVCDRPTGHDTAAAEASDVAADLIDDFFDQDLDDDDEDHPTAMDEYVAPQRQEDGFVFGLVDTPKPPPMQQSFTFGVNAVTSPPSVVGAATVFRSGQGRGRGRTVPAWMMQPK